MELEKRMCLPHIQAYFITSLLRDLRKMQQGKSHVCSGLMSMIASFAREAAELLRHLHACCIDGSCILARMHAGPSHNYRTYYGH